MSHWDDKEARFSQLTGKVITEIRGLEVGSEEVTFITADGKEYYMYHSQDCCESVSVEDIAGDIEDIMNTDILLAEEVSSNENPPDIPIPEYQDSFTWTFYKLATIKGRVTIRWYGTSNGYYSESVYFRERK